MRPTSHKPQAAATARRCPAVHPLRRCRRRRSPAARFFRMAGFRMAGWGGFRIRCFVPMAFASPVRRGVAWPSCPMIRMLLRLRAGLERLGLAIITVSGSLLGSNFEMMPRKTGASALILLSHIATIAVPAVQWIFSVPVAYHSIVVVVVVVVVV